MSIRSWFPWHELPVFSGPNPENPGQFGKFMAWSYKQGGMLDKFLSLSGLYSLLKIAGEPGIEQETIFGGILDKGYYRKPTIYLSEEAQKEKPAPPPEPPAGATMPGYFLEPQYI